MNALALPPRARAAVLVTRGVNALSRHLGTGSGTVAGATPGWPSTPSCSPTWPPDVGWPW